MTFWKSSKRREGAISDPKILVADLSTSRKKRTTVFGNKGGAGEGHVKVEPKCAEAVNAKFIFEVLGATAFRKYRFLGSPGKNR